MNLGADKFSGFVVRWVLILNCDFAASRTNSGALRETSLISPGGNSEGLPFGGDLHRSGPDLQRGEYEPVEMRQPRVLINEPRV
jgi:hypothetical protein